MACEKYSSWMMDAALGALPSSSRTELLAHVETCEMCRKAYASSQQAVAFADRAVNSLVDGAPSPAFAARLRSRLAEEPSPARWGARITWAPVAATALILAAVLIVAATYIPRRGHSTLFTASRALPTPDAPEATGNPPPTHANLVNANPGRRASESVGDSEESAVLIEPGQLVMAMQMADAIASGSLNGKELASEHPQMDEPSAERPADHIVHFTDDHDGL